MKLWRALKLKKIKFAIVVSLLLTSALASADGLKVFGREFCGGYDAGACINLNRSLIDAKTWTGQYKYPKGRAAFEKCVAGASGTDGDIAYCSMIFHREEQSPSKRAEMCAQSVRQKYSEVASDYAMRLYDSVWSCGK